MGAVKLVIQLTLICCNAGVYPLFGKMLNTLQINNYYVKICYLDNGGVYCNCAKVKQDRNMLPSHLSKYNVGGLARQKFKVISWLAKQLVK